MTSTVVILDAEKIDTNLGLWPRVGVSNSWCRDWCRSIGHFVMGRSEKNALQSLVHKVGLVIEQLSVQFLPQPSCGFLIEYQTLPKSPDTVKYKLLLLFHGWME